MPFCLMTWFTGKGNYRCSDRYYSKAEEATCEERGVSVFIFSTRRTTPPDRGLAYIRWTRLKRNLHTTWYEATATCRRDEMTSNALHAGRRKFYHQLQHGRYYHMHQLPKDSFTRRTAPTLWECALDKRNILIEYRGKSKLDEILQ